MRFQRRPNCAAGMRTASSDPVTAWALLIVAVIVGALLLYELMAIKRE
jgi:hypothetical protein